MADSAKSVQAALAHRYPIERELGSGGMATVYLARDLKHGRRVAIKVLHPELAATLGAGRFVREIEIAARLNHPHVLPLFDSGEADGYLYYVMPYVEGESLRDRLSREGAMPVHEVVRITEQIASALTYAHERGVIHRDIKPENILLAGDQGIVADFGIARAVELAGAERLTRTGMAIGTPAYMSPEQGFGGEEPGPATDVYALGCVVFEMLTGRRAFDAPTPRAILAKHAAGAVPSVRTGAPEVPVTVDNAVQRALAKAPGDRFGSAVRFAGALSAAITTDAQLAEARRMMRRRWRRGAIAATVVTAVALGGWWLAGARRLPAIEHLAVLPASNMTRDSAQDPFVDGAYEVLVTELQRAGLPVHARQSALQYRDTDKPIRQIAQELGVDALVLPSVGREADSVVVDVSLYDGRSELLLWTSTFSSRMEGVLGLYRDISRRIADRMGFVLSAMAETRLAQRAAIDPEAMEAVLRGQGHLRRFTPQDLTIALQYFRSALIADSAYAPAHLGVAEVWVYRAQAGLVSAGEAEPYIEEQLARALALDPQLARARSVRAARIVWGYWDLEQGFAAYRQALDIDPNDAETQVFFGHLLMILGRWDEAVRRGELAVSLDPLNPFVVGLHGTILAMAGRSDEAIEVIRDMFGKNPGASFGFGGLHEALYAEGRYSEQLQLERERFASRGNQAVVDALDTGFAEGGYAGAWKAAADMLASTGRGQPTGAMGIALLYAQAGEAEEALDWLALAVEQRDQNIPYIGVIPTLRTLHSNIRFQQLVREVGVPLLEPPEG